MVIWWSSGGHLVVKTAKNEQPQSTLGIPATGGLAGHFQMASQQIPLCSLASTTEISKFRFGTLNRYKQRLINFVVLAGALYFTLLLQVIIWPLSRAWLFLH
ncbi:hypothetical protein [Lactiplantibacillus plantarum]|uniref:hypothetical protein n=1 Tax=Lactiplantibacillus plantarum TaxID=1590 RepID=UPI001C1F6976|nr:hypothetical protein [Lactiplantibacillus plantarum]MBU7471949.1 hypothetical protein [Lactiplantibacillus plantarum]